MLTIRPATAADHDPIWQIMHEVISSARRIRLTHKRPVPMH